MLSLLIRARYAVALVVAATLVGLLAWDRHVAYDQSITSFFAADDPTVVEYRRSSSLFGNDNLVFVVYDDPALLTPAGMARVGELAEALGPKHIEAVVDVQSLDAMPQFWRIDDELIRLQNLPAFLRTRAERLAKGLVKNLDPGSSAMTVAGAVREAKTDAQRKALRDRVTRHPLLQGTVVDASAKSAAVVVRLRGMGEQDPKATVAALRAVADGFAARHRFRPPALVGPPVLLADGFHAIELDGRRLALVGMLLIGLVTLSATHSLWWSVVPLVAGWTVWRATETILSLLGLRLSLSGGPLVAQIMVLTMPAVGHLAVHFRDALRRDGDRRKAADHTLAAVTSPILWCAITGAIGYGALVTSNVVPVRQFGAVLAVATLAAAVLTLAISPTAMLPPFPLEIPVKTGSTSRLGHALNRLLIAVDRRPAPVVVGVLAAVLPLLFGIGRLEYESNYINAFKPDTRVVRDYQAVESRLGGIGLVSLVVPLDGPIDLKALAKFREVDGEVLRIGGDPDVAAARVDRVISPATVLDPDGRLAALGPEKGARAIALKLELIGSSAQADLLESFWNRGESSARTLVRVSERQSAALKEATFETAERNARAVFGDGTFLTGISYLLTQTTRGVIATQWTTFFWSAGGILLMLTLAFRGPAMAVLSLLPTMLSVGFVLGLMGWIGVKLDVATALVASVALGLSVDDTFHCLLQYRLRRSQHASFNAALFSAYAVSGPGVLLSSLAVAVGFSVLRFSEFVPFSNFGAMVAIATLGSTLGNLVLLPACLALGNRLRESRVLRRSRTDAPADASDPR